jgi:tetratricopeptide (TPR) repeat protein
MKPLICIALLTFWNAQASEAPKAYADWVSEGKALATAGNYPAAAQAFRQALVMAEGSDAGNRTLVGIHDALASVYAEAGQYAESEREYRHALEIVEKTQSRKSLDYAVLTASFALLPTQLGNRDSFTAILREAIALFGSSGSARELAIIRACLAQILMEGRKYAEAESLLLDGQADFDRLSGTNPRLFAKLLNNLGSLRFKQGRYQQSMELYRESLRLSKDAIGDEHPERIVPLSNLGLSYLKLGRLDDAGATLQRAIKLCGKTLGEDHAACGAILENRAAVLRRLGRKREAKAVSARSRQIARAWRRHNGIDSTISVTALRSRGN